jgi:hypoxanthine phosphoribosyltransferase
MSDIHFSDEQPPLTDRVDAIPTILPEHIRYVFSKSTCLYSKAEVDAALDRLSTEISYQLGNSNPIFLCVVVGGMVALGNMLPRLDFPLEVDYIHATRYRNTTVGHELTWKSLPSTPLKGRSVVIVDDILDGGITLDGIVKYCTEQQAESIYTAVLVEKEGTRLPEGLPNADCCGMQVEDRYVFGYGMDYKGYLRNAPGIYAVADEHT